MVDKSVKKTKAEKPLAKDDQDIKQEAVEVKAKLDENPIAKAGKRSSKAVKETELQIKKEERKKETTESEKKPAAITIKPSRSRLERRGKKYQEVAKLLDNTKSYPLAEALVLAVKTSPVKFDAAVEVHLNLNVNPRLADQNMRDVVIMPSGTGKKLRVSVLAEPDLAEQAKKAGADNAGIDEIFQQLDKQNYDFDVLIATPSVMSRLGTYAKSLGPKGLMPNPKSGTVTKDVVKAVKEAKAGRVEYRVDSTGIVHLAFGKVSFGDKKLLENVQAVIDSLRNNKPASVKGALIESAYITTSMGPSIKVDISSI